MKLTIIPLIAALSALAPAFARISNVTFPDSATVGGTLQLNVSESGYIQNWDDLGILVGFGSDSGLKNCAACVGAQGQFYSNIYNNDTLIGTNRARPSSFVLEVPVPSYLNTSETWRVTAAVPYVVGAMGGTHIRFWNHTVTLNPAA